MDQPFAKRKNVVLPIGSTFRFPDKCVYCGMPKFSNIILTPSIVTRKGKLQTTRSTTIYIPYCAQHAMESDQNKTAMYGVSIVASIISGLLAYALFTALDKLSFFSQMDASVSGLVHLGEFLLFFVIILFCGSLAPLFVSSYFSKLPIFNTSLRDTPVVSIMDFFGQGNKPDHALGLSTILENYSSVSFEFTNHTIAAEFSALNRTGASPNVDAAQKDTEKTRNSLATKLPSNKPSQVICSNCGYENYKKNTKCSQCLALFE